MLRTLCFGVLATLWLTDASALGDGDDAFIAHYLSAAPRIEAAYTHVTIDGTYLQYTPAGKLDMQNDLSLCIDGDKYCKTMVATIDASPDFPAGTMGVEMSTPDLSMNASRLPDAVDFKFFQYGKADPQKSKEYRQIRLIAASGPYCVLGQCLSDMLKSPMWKLQSADDVTLDGKPRVKVCFLNAGTDKKVRTKSIEAVLDAKDWCITAYTVDFGGSTAHGRIEYDDHGDFPRRVKVAETWLQAAGKNEKLNRVRMETTTYDFAKPPAERFTLQGLGVNTLPPPEMMK